MKILCFASSLRSGSLNKKYVRVAHTQLSGIPGVEAQLIELNDFQLPIFDQDIEDKEFPLVAQRLAELVRGSQAVVVSTPEYNGSITPLLKNTVDWLSRARAPNPWPGRHVLLLGASPGALGAVRGLWHSRIPFEALGCHVYPEMSGLARAQDAFDDHGGLKEAATADRLNKLLTGFVEHLKRAR